MSKCDFCQSETPKNDYCPNCGTTLYTAEGKIFYGATKKDVCGCEVSITEKYLIIRKVSKAESTGDAIGRGIGLLGVLVAEAASQKVRPHGFYELSNFQKGIFPYRNKGIKGKDSIKLITNDGKDFILKFDTPGFIDSVRKVIKTMVKNISDAIPVVEDGTEMNFGEQYCINPYVTLDTFDKVKPGYIPPQNVTVTQEPIAQPQINHTEPIVPVVPQEPAKEPVPVEPPAPIQVVAPVKESVKVEKEQIKCSNCGTLLAATNKFCSQCGTKIVLEKKCAQCGNVLGEIDKFCGQCGCKVI